MERGGGDGEGYGGNNLLVIRDKKEGEPYPYDSPCFSLVVPAGFEPAFSP